MVLCNSNGMKCSQCFYLAEAAQIGLRSIGHTIGWSRAAASFTLGYKIVVRLEGHVDMFIVLFWVLRNEYQAVVLCHLYKLYSPKLHTQLLSYLELRS